MPLTDYSSWIHQEGNTIVVATEDLTIDGTYTIECTSTLETLPESAESTVSFQLEVVDPCYSTAFYDVYQLPDMNASVLGAS